MSYIRGFRKFFIFIVILGGWDMGESRHRYCKNWGAQNGVPEKNSNLSCSHSTSVGNMYQRIEEWCSICGFDMSEKRNIRLILKFSSYGILTDIAFYKARLSIAGVLLRWVPGSLYRHMSSLDALCSRVSCIITSWSLHWWGKNYVATLCGYHW